MLFSDRLSDQEVPEAKAASGAGLLGMLVSDFRKAFPELTYELRLEFKTINAQALKLQDKRLVTIYGGLALHPGLGTDALTLVLLHETGHHLAEGCRLPRDPFLACECAADYWAATEGIERLRERSGRSLNLETALVELRVIMNTGQRQRRRYSKNIPPSACWAKSWALRSRALLKRTRPPATAGCCAKYI
jgi:hypothetical protein